MHNFLVNEVSHFLSRMSMKYVDSIDAYLGSAPEPLPQLQHPRAQNRKKNRTRFDATSNQVLFFDNGLLSTEGPGTKRWFSGTDRCVFHGFAPLSRYMVFEIKIAFPLVFASS